METLESIKSDYELERGKPMPSWNHSVIQSNLIYFLRVRYNQTHSFLSELSLGLSDAEQKMVPDVSIYPKTAHYLTTDQITVTESPETVIEILSPTQNVAELTDKAERYLALGVKSCWIIVPGLCNASVSSVPGVYQTFDRHETLHDSATGIELDLSALFS